MLHLHQYEKSFGTEPVLRVPELFLPAGIYHIQGGNGAGKTTLLQSVAGLIPFKGTITVHGIHINTQRILYRKRVSYAEAEPVYPDFLTGYELIRFYLQTKGGSQAAAMQVAEQLGVDRFMKQRIATYSSGMVKKLSLVLAFVGTPQLILLDEPFTTLDTAAMNVLSDLITHNARQGTGFLMTSHHHLELAVPVQTLAVRNQTFMLNEQPCC